MTPQPETAGHASVTRAGPQPARSIAVQTRPIFVPAATPLFMRPIAWLPAMSACGSARPASARRPLFFVRLTLPPYAPPATPTSTPPTPLPGATSASPSSPYPASTTALRPPIPAVKLLSSPLWRTPPRTV